MTYLRLFDHSFRLPPVLVMLGEWFLLVVAAYAGIWFRFQTIDPIELSRDLTGSLVLKAMTFATVLSLCTHAMRVYESALSEGQTGTLLRTLVSYSLLGCTALTVLYYMLPSLYLGRGVLAIAVAVATILVSLFRMVYFASAEEERFRRKVLVLGAGARAKTIEKHVFQPDMRGNIRIVGFMPVNDERPQVEASHVLDGDKPLPQLADELGIDEIVVALDSRRQSDGGFFPADDLLQCKLDGISVLEAMNFYERELQLVELSELRASWMVYTDGFTYSVLRDLLKRAFDIVVSVLLLLLIWPVMLLTVLLIKVEDGLQAPVLFRQARVGTRGKEFEVLKFRSMVQDAEKDGEAQWAVENDPRVTRIGRFIRDLRVDELPQIYNVLRGEMSFVGPRPERPEFVEAFIDQIPFYDARHTVRPGLMGWLSFATRMEQVPRTRRKNLDTIYTM